MTWTYLAAFADTVALSIYNFWVLDHSIMSSSHHEIFMKEHFVAWPTESSSLE